MRFGATSDSCQLLLHLYPHCNDFKDYISTNTICYELCLYICADSGCAQVTEFTSFVAIESRQDERDGKQGELFKLCSSFYHVFAAQIRQSSDFFLFFV